MTTLSTVEALEPSMAPLRRSIGPSLATRAVAVVQVAAWRAPRRLLLWLAARIRDLTADRDAYWAIEFHERQAPERPGMRVARRQPWF